MKIKNKILVSACAFFATICTAFGVTQFSAPAKTLAEQAATSTGLTEATLNRVDSTVTTAGTMDSVAFDGFTAGTASATYFMVDFVGQNLPNFVVNATQVYDAYTADAFGTVGNGMLFSSTAGSNRLALTSGIVGKSQWGDLASATSSSIESIATWEFTDTVSGLGLAFLQENEHYIAVLGYEPTAAATTTVNYSFYLFKETNGTLNKIATVLATDKVGNATGQYAVIYPNIDYGPEEITFSYATPKGSLDNLINELSENYTYKKQLRQLLGVPNMVTATLTSLKKNVNLTADGVTAEGTTVDSISFDGFSGSTWFMTQFTGHNVPNFAVQATNVYSTWNKQTAQNDAGYTINNTEYGNWGYLNISNGLQSASKYRSYSNSAPDTASDSYATATKTGTACGMGRMSSTSEYVMLVGWEQTAERAVTFNYYLYKLSEGALTLDTSIVHTGIALPAAGGSKAVIYPNLHYDSQKTITFSYAQPKQSVGELLLSLEGVAYKSQLLTLHGVQTKTLTMTDESGATIESKTVLKTADYVLPTSNIDGFVGWSYNEGLYQAGAKIVSEENITVKAVCLEMDVLDGASARLKIDEDGDGGLRFTVKAKTADLTALGANVEMHGVMIPTDMINGEFDLNETGAKDIVLSNSVALNDGYTYYYITLTDVIYSNYNRAFSARAYAKVTYADEGTANMAATAYDKTNNSRSIYDVAVAAYNDGEESDGILARYIGYTVNLAYSVSASDEYVFSVVDTEDGLDVASVRKYSIVSQNVTTVEGVTGVTVTIKFTDLPTTLSLEKAPVTVWAEGSSKGERMDITVQSTDEEQGTVTCFFQLA